MPAQHSILIVDDEPNLRHTLALILEQTGYTVATAKNTAAAGWLLQENSYDLIFLDLQMPDGNGIDFLPNIRQLHPQTPVLILTAHATLESATEAVRQGARDYLFKPIDPEHILARVREVLAEQQQPQRQREIVTRVQELLSELRQISSGAAPSSEVLALPASDPTRLLQCGPLTLDLHTRYVTLAGRAVTLPPTAFEYLVVLARHTPDPVPYQTLVLEAQGYETTPIEARDMARWHIFELRKALEPNPSRPRYVITLRNVGYRLVT
ncbi:MAG: response regulator transcription factor [Anaerolineae bacterium]